MSVSHIQASSETDPTVAVTAAHSECSEVNATHSEANAERSKVNAEGAVLAEGSAAELTDAGETHSDADSDHSTAGNSTSLHQAARRDSLAEASEAQLPAAAGSVSSASLPEEPSAAATAVAVGSEASRPSLLTSQQEQEIAVLTLIAGVAADSAAAVINPTAEAASAAGADSAATAEASTSGDSEDDDLTASENILLALRGDARVSEQWHVVKAGRKAPSHPVKAADRPTDTAALQDQANGSIASLTKAKDRPVVSTPSQAPNIGADPLWGKSMRRSPSSASASSWESVAEAFEGSDRSAALHVQALL